MKAILKQKDRFYTQIKIDEIDNLGAVKIRLRSLKAAVEERKRNRMNYGVFTPEMKQTHTILVPGMLAIHFRLFPAIFETGGYHVEVLYNEGDEVVEEGLSHVHNDTCYPALLVIGQMIAALKSGKYDLNKVALAITQTGGGCRASNYIFLLRKALAMEGWAQFRCFRSTSLVWRKKTPWR